MSFWGKNPKLGRKKNFKSFKFVKFLYMVQLDSQKYIRIFFKYFYYEKKIILQSNACKHTILNQ